MFTNGVSVVTATWNEIANIAELVSKTRKVLQDLKHEIIIIDDGSTDETFQIANRIADVAITNKRVGQTRSLLKGMHVAKYPVIITIDADLENDPIHVLELLQELNKCDIVVASRTKLPRISEKITSKTLGKLVGVNDPFSNFRAYKKDVISKFSLRGGETFGAEFLVIAKKNKLRIGEILFEPPPRRKNPRIGGTVKANLRINWALIKSLIIYLT